MKCLYIFAKDDDYNKPIPSQYAESLNYPVPAANLSRTFIGGDNDLCDRCNRNQLLKVKQLANFVAYDEVPIISRDGFNPFRVDQLNSAPILEMQV